MLVIQRVSEPVIERRGGPDNRVSVRFKLSREPEDTWISQFKAHAASSVLNAASTIVRGAEVYTEVAKPRGVSELTTALDCFIECANLGLRSLGGRVSERESPASGERRRLRDRV